MTKYDYINKEEVEYSNIKLGLELCSLKTIIILHIHKEC